MGAAADVALCVGMRAWVMTGGGWMRQALESRFDLSLEGIDTGLVPLKVKQRSVLRRADVLRGLQHGTPIGTSLESGRTEPLRRAVVRASEAHLVWRVRLLSHESERWLARLREVVDPPSSAPALTAASLAAERERIRSLTVTAQQRVKQVLAAGSGEQALLRAITARNTALQAQLQATVELHKQVEATYAHSTQALRRAVPLAQTVTARAQPPHSVAAPDSAQAIELCKKIVSDTRAAVSAWLSARSALDAAVVKELGLEPAPTSTGSAGSAGSAGGRFDVNPLRDAEKAVEGTTNVLEAHLYRCFHSLLPAVEQCVQRLPAELMRSRVMLEEAQRELSAQRQQLEAAVKWAAELPTFEAKLKDTSETVLDLTEELHSQEGKLRGAQTRAAAKRDAKSDANVKSVEAAVQQTREKLQELGSARRVIEREMMRAVGSGLFPELRAADLKLAPDELLRDRCLTRYFPPVFS
jgi:hypothetical protein